MNEHKRDDSDEAFLCMVLLGWRKIYEISAIYSAIRVGWYRSCVLSDVKTGFIGTSHLFYQ